MKLFLLASLGGAIGAGLRYLTYVACGQWLSADFPWATLIVNIVGSFMMGAVTAAFLPYLGSSVALRTFLATGILGGFTTFSAFSLDAVTLYENDSHVGLALYLVGSVLLSILALIVGIGVVRMSLR